MPKYIKYLILTSIFVVSCNQSLIVSINSSHIPITKKTDTIKNVEMEGLINKYNKHLLSISEEIIGYANADILSGHPESSLGNFFTTAMLEFSNQHSITKVDFAVTNSGGLRNPIKKGNIKVANIYELMPFENKLVILDLKGSSVKSLLDSIASHRGCPVSGIRFGIKNKLATNILINGEAIDYNKIYRVATNDYIAKGNDYFIDFTKAIKTEYLQTPLREIILEWIRTQTKKGNQINAILDGRIYEDKN